MREGISREDLQAFVDWVTLALQQLEETRNPHENGWQANEDIPGQWYMVVGVHWLPSPD